MTQEEIKLFFDFWAGQVIVGVFFACIVSIIVASVFTDYLRLFADEKKELDENKDPNKELSENFEAYKEKLDTSSLDMSRLLYGVVFHR